MRRATAPSKNDDNKKSARTRDKRDKNGKSTSTKRTHARTRDADTRTPRFVQEVGGVLVILLGVVVSLSLYSFDPSDLETNGAETLNLVGPVGAHLADILLHLFGLGAFVFAAAIGLVGVLMTLGRRIEMKPSEMVGHLLLIVGGSVLFHMAYGGEEVMAHMPGGAVGAVAGEAGRALFNDVGACVLSVGALLLGIILVTDTSFGAVLRTSARLGRRAVGALRHARLPRLSLPRRRRPTQTADGAEARSHAPTTHRATRAYDEAQRERLARESARSKTAARSNDDGAQRERGADPMRRKRVEARNRRAERARQRRLRRPVPDIAGLRQGPEAEAAAAAPEGGAAAAAGEVARRIARAARPMVDRVADAVRGVADKRSRHDLSKAVQPAPAPVADSPSMAIVTEPRVRDDARPRAASLQPPVATDDAARLKIANILARLPRKKEPAVGAAPPRPATPDGRDQREPRVVEPQFEFESIVPPEAIADGSVLAGWKPTPLRKAPAAPARSKPADADAARRDRQQAARTPRPRAAGFERGADRARRSAVQQPAGTKPADPRPEDVRRSARTRPRPTTRPGADSRTGEGRQVVRRKSARVRGADRPHERDRQPTRRREASSLPAIEELAAAAAATPAGLATPVELPSGRAARPQPEGAGEAVARGPRDGAPTAASVPSQRAASPRPRYVPPTGAELPAAPPRRQRPERPELRQREAATVRPPAAEASARRQFDDSEVDVDALDRVLARAQAPDTEQQLSADEVVALDEPCEPPIRAAAASPRLATPTQQSTRPTAVSASMQVRIKPAPVTPIGVDDDDDEDDDDDDEFDDALEDVTDEPPARVAAAREVVTAPPPPSVEEPAAPDSEAGERESDDEGPSIVLSEARVKVRSEEDLEQAAEKRRQSTPQVKRPWVHPPLSLLSLDPDAQIGYDADELRRMADRLEQKLLDFKVEGKVVEICPGPVVTRFEFKPAPGTRVAKIANLSDDLKMALEAIAIRVLAPIPGKGVVGIEVPNDQREIVFLKEILGSDAFNNSRSVLTFALGKDIEGNPVVTDLAKMPHVLVAGATGAGKSVCINTMLCSLLFNSTPDEVKLILVDPKCLELSMYNGVPHLLLPPITEAKKTAAALNWAVDEMETRYRLMADMRVRNIKGYNKRIARLETQAEDLDTPEGKRALDRLGENEDGSARHKHLPYIVIVIDELADLMMTVGKEIETSIARLAQKARACGIHLVLATQRPSVDVLTGLIKANFPTRMAFRVSNRHDSKTILDQSGAEALLGMGDMLFLPPGTSALTRVHGAFLSDDEAERVVDFLKDQAEPEYDERILASNSDGEGPGGDSDEEYDEYYDEAVKIVVDCGQASISMLQRKLRIGYQRAARIVDCMEQEGIVGPSESGARRREVLVNNI